MILSAVLAGAAAAGVRPLRIVPNKIVYPVGEKGWADVVLTNTSAKAECAPYVVTDSWDVDGSSREICRGEAELSPLAGKTVRIAWPGSDVRYGHELRVTVKGEGGESSRAEYFAVNTDWWRVAQGLGLDTISETVTPLFRQFMEYYGLPVRPPRCTAAYRLWMEANEIEGYGMGAFPGYQTLLTRWQMQLCSVGGNKAAADMPDGKRWYSTTEVTEARDSGRIREDGRVSRDHGVHHTRYTIGFMEGPYGFEVARKRPEFLLRTERGQPVGYYQDPRVDPVWISEVGNGRQGAWTYLRPDFDRDDTVEWAVRDLAAGIDGFGEDGVYWDGPYIPDTGYDSEGRLKADPKDRAACAARAARTNRLWYDQILKGRPERFAWMNRPPPSAKNRGVDPYVQPRTGTLLEYQWSFLLSPSHPSNTYRGMLDEMRMARDSRYLPLEDGAMPSKVFFVGYLVPAWQPRPKDDPGQYREVWTMAQHVMSVLASTLAHPVAGGPQMRNFKQMMMRYSQFYWHEDIEVLEDGYRRFRCDSQREVWYEDMIYRRETKDYTDYYVHLVNVPESERCREDVVTDPPAVNDVVVSTKLFGAAGVKAWSIQPYAYLDPVLEPHQVSVPVKSSGGETVVKMPSFRYYTLLVIRVPSSGRPCAQKRREVRRSSGSRCVENADDGTKDVHSVSAKLLPDRRVGGVILRDQNRLYVVGGNNVCGVQQITRIDLDAADLPTGSKWCAQIAPDQLGCVSAAIFGRWLYVTGGNLKGKTVRFEIQPDGELANRTEIPNEGLPNSNMAGLVATGSYLVLAGGWQTRTVFAAKVNADGSLGPWTRQSPLPANCFTLGRIFRLGKRLFIAGNPGYRQEAERVYSSEVASDGAVTKWQRWADLPETTVDFDFQPLPDGRGFYYRSGETGAQYVAPLVGDDEIGPWRKLSARFPDGPYVLQVGIPLLGGRYLRYSGYKSDPPAFPQAEIVNMVK